LKRSKGGYSKHGRNLKARGKATITRHLRVFKEGERVRVTPDPAFSAGRVSNLRFKGATGVVMARRGGAYEVEVKQGNKRKRMMMSNLHLTRV